MFTIGITTFRRRYDMVEKLISQIKSYKPDIEIILTVNADYHEKFDEEYRVKILNLCQMYNSIFPIIFPKFTGLSKMWNTIILNASSEYILVLNDDIELTNDIFTKVEEYIVEVAKSNEMRRQIFTINHSFSHFVCSKDIIDQLGYFDERLLAFGEEDGDLTWRYIQAYQQSIDNIQVEGIQNQAEGYRIPHPNMEVMDVHGRRLVPKFNRHFIMEEKYKKSIWGIQGMFERKMKKQLEDEKQYPYERFKRENYERL